MSSGSYGAGADASVREISCGGDEAGVDVSWYEAGAAGCSRTYCLCLVAGVYGYVVYISNVVGDD